MARLDAAFESEMVTCRSGVEALSIPEVEHSSMSFGV